METWKDGEVGSFDVGEMARDLVRVELNLKLVRSRFAKPHFLENDQHKRQTTTVKLVYFHSFGSADFAMDMGRLWGWRE